MEQRRSIHLKIGTVKIGEGEMREVKLEGKKIGNSLARKSRQLICHRFLKRVRLGFPAGGLHNFAAPDFACADKINAWARSSVG
jgi:hypothetical protein